jgi:MarR family 2-MHQ and catechol resistance regulon transcriptional repressor
MMALDENGGEHDGAHVLLFLELACRCLHTGGRQVRRRVALGESEFGILEQILQFGPMTLNVLGQRVNLTSGSMTIAVDRLEARSLVVRKCQAYDKRLKVVELTSGGRKLIEKGHREHKIYMDHAVSVLSEPQRVNLIALLKQLTGSELSGEPLNLQDFIEANPAEASVPYQSRSL